MKNILYTFILLVGVIFFGAIQTHAEVAATPSVTVNTSGDSAQDGPAGVTSNPSSNAAQDGAAGVTSNPSSDAAQDGPVAPTPPGNGGGTGGNGGGGNPGGSSGSTGGSGSGSSGGSSSGSVAFLSSVPAFTGATTSCPLLTDYLKFGGTNNPIQVTKLQIFLKNAEKAAVTVSGNFDEATENAVKDFQKKYLSDILGPWDATRSTGFVYITTMKKINQLVCAQPLTLSADEVAIIEAYKARGSVDQADTATTSISGPVGSLVTDTMDTDDNTAAAVNSSILSRFWEFLKNLFR